MRGRGRGVSSDRPADASFEPPYVSTGRLPSPDVVSALVSEAHGLFRTNRDGRVSDIYPALASVAPDLFGLCVTGASGATYASGDWDYPFSIMSVSKPFVFALVLQVLGPDAARRRLRQRDRPAVQLAGGSRTQRGRPTPSSSIRGNVRST
jgi:glutaminase